MSEDKKCVYLLAEEVYKGFTDSEEDRRIQDIIRDRHYEMYHAFVTIVNKHINKWNDAYEAVNVHDDCWNPEYDYYMFARYCSVADYLNEKKGYADSPFFPIIIAPIMIPEREESAGYKGQKTPVYSVCVKGHPEKYMHIEFLPKMYDTAKEANDALKELKDA